MFKLNKWQIFSLLELLIIGCLLFYKQPIVNYINNTDIVKTVSHISLSEDYEVIYTDCDNDITYYRYVGERDFVTVGETVYTCNADAVTVTATDVHGFYVTCNNVFYSGMSGTVILNSNGNCVGYVSELLTDNTVYCIWR